MVNSNFCRRWIICCLGILFGLLLDTGCAAYVLPREAWVPPDPSKCVVHTHVIVDSRLPPEQQATVRQAMRLWYVATKGKACLDESGGPVANMPLPILAVQNVSTLNFLIGTNFDTNIAGLYRRGNSMHQVFLVMDNISDNTSLLVVAIHELGHSMGLQHIMDNTACMWPSINRSCLLTQPGSLPGADLLQWYLVNGNGASNVEYGDHVLYN